MIMLTKRNHEKFLVNHLQIEYIETIPESKIVMMNHDFYLVRESTDEIIEINKKEEEQRKKNGVEENPYADLFDEEASRHNRKRNRPLDSSDNSDSSDNPDSSDSSDEDSGTPPPFTK